MPDIRVVEAGPECLVEYARIPIAFRVEAIYRVREQAKAYADEALASLNDIPYSDEGKAILKDAVEFIVNREL